MQLINLSKQLTRLIREDLMYYSVTFIKWHDFRGSSLMHCPISTIISLFFIDESDCERAFQKEHILFTI